MIIYINGRGMNAPELKAYISELEAENVELRAKVESAERQIAEHKRLLKAAIADFAAIAEVHAAVTPILCPQYGKYMKAIDVRTRKWQYADEALALIEEEGDTGEYISRDLALRQPVKRGRWESPVSVGNGIKFCSVCLNEAYWDTDYGQQLFDYCPYCGARMDGDT